jgi:hypothetical protein
MGVALDSAGSIYIADSNNDRIRKVSASTVLISTVAGNGYCCDYGDGVTATSARLSPFNVEVDRVGNIYFADGHSIRKVDVSDPPALSFATTAVGSTSSDSPQTVTVQNIGNAPLNFSGVTASTNFNLDGITTTCSTSSPLAAGDSCVVGVVFSPTAGGSLSGALMLTDNALNVSGATQQVTLSGTGVQAGLQAVAPSPRVLTLPATGVGTTTATIKGIVNPDWAAATSPTYWVEYSTSEAFRPLLQTSHQPLSPGATETAVSVGLTGLAPRTVYHYRVVAQDNIGISRGRVLEFHTAEPKAKSSSIPASLTDSAQSQIVTSGGASASSALPAVRNSSTAKTIAANNVSTQTATLEVAPGPSMPLVVSVAGVIQGTPMTATCANLPVGATCTYNENTQTVTITPSASTPPGSYQVGVVATVAPEAE